MTPKFSPASFFHHVFRKLLITCVVLCAAFSEGSFADSLDYPGKDPVPVKDLDLLSDTTQVEYKSISSLAGDSLHSTDTAGKKNPSPTQALAENSSSEKGVIFSAENDKPVPKVLVLLSNGEHKYSTSSNEAGIYNLDGIAPGAYRLKVVKKGFAVYELESVDLKAGQANPRVIRLERSIIKGQMIEAKGGRNAGSAASMMAARRSSSGVMEGVSAEQIAKSTDADAGAVAKRLTGTSLVGGKYIYVRGLGERYTNMTLNGLPVPSPEKDKRVVPQDLFPSSALDRFVLFKTFSPDLYADFAGGSVALETKGIPEKRFLKVSVGMGGTDYSDDDQFLNFGQDRLTYNGGNTYWGFGDGTRAKPKGVPDVIPILTESEVAHYKELGLPAATQQERIGYALSFRNTYALDTTRILPNQNFSLSLGDVYPLSGDGKVGYIFSAGFKNKYTQKRRSQSLLGSATIKHQVSTYYPDLDLTFVIDAPLMDTLPDSTTREIQHIAPGIRRDVSTGSYEAVLTGLANFGWDINPDQHFFWKNFLVNIGTDEAGKTIGRELKTGTQLKQDQPYEEKYLLEFTRRSLLSSQLGGSHYLGVGPVDSGAWTVGYSYTRGETPDSRKYLYSRQTDSSTSFENYNNDVWGTRIYEDLRENAVAGRSDAFLSIPPQWSVRDRFLEEGRVISQLRLPEARAGLAGNFRTREFNVTRYSYDRDKNIYINSTLEQIRQPSILKSKIENHIFNADFYTSPKNYDEYTAAEGVYAGYFSAASGLSLWNLPLDFDAGFRAEWHVLNFNAPYTGVQFGDNKAKIDSATVRINRDNLNWLPSLGFTAHPYANGKLHLHYANTVSRPEVREIAPFEYYDYERSRTTTGNPDLKETSIRHWDLRWESFFPGQQLLSVSLFDKQFQDPIENVVDDNNCVTFQNANSGNVSGIEFEGNADFASIVGLTGWEPSALRGWTLYGNLAFMRSHVLLDTTTHSNGCSDRNQLTSQSRSMVGQSPYLWNLKLAHEVEWRQFSLLNALLFNVAGERIKDVGINGAPDIYEQPFPSLDYLGKALFYKRFELSWSVKNLLDRAKRSRGYEFNASKSYYTLTPNQVQTIFAPFADHYDTEVVKDGVSYEVKLSYAL